MTDVMMICSPNDSLQLEIEISEIQNRKSVSRYDI